MFPCKLFLKVFFSALILTYSRLNAQPNDPLYINADQQNWVDSVMRELTIKEKIGQLFMVAAYSNKNEEHYDQIEDLVRRYHIGGLIFFQGGPVRQVHLTNRYQKASKIPLLIGMDLEWGLGMRLDSTISFPRQMALGAISDNRWIYRMGEEISRQMKHLGVHINFAPVADINSNPNNPVIGIRSFGEDRSNVAEKSIAYMKGLQEHGIIANAKHFPGHGDTGSDSHYTMPVISHSKDRLDTMELYPFRTMINKGLQSMMVAHINIPELERNRKRPATLSETIVTDLLKNDLGFHGLIFTDALNMQGVTQYYQAGDADINAFMAGNDVLLFPLDVPRAFSMIQNAVKRNKITTERLNYSVRKILKAKYIAGLNTFHPINPQDLIKKINPPKASMLKQQLYEQAITLVTNRNDLLPVKHLDDKNFASVSINSKSSGFHEALSTYTNFAKYTYFDKTSEIEKQKILEDLKHFDVVVIGLHGLSNSRRNNFGIPDQVLKFINAANAGTKIILTVFGNPYSLVNFEHVDHLICAYEDDPLAHYVAAEAIFGAIGFEGTLPVSASETLPAGTGVKTDKLGRLGFGYPEGARMDSRILDQIDGMVAQAITDTTMPGCQILIAKDNRIVFNKNYGFYTYDSLFPVSSGTIWDVASVTKAAATLQAIMFLEERDLIDPDKKASYYLPSLRGTNKENMILRDILTHQAGLWPYLPFYKQTLKEQSVNMYYSPFVREGFTNQIADGIYARNDLADSIWNWTVSARIREKESRKPYDYTYSDMGYYMLKRICEDLLNQPIDDFLHQNFYAPLGMNNTAFNPLCKFPYYRIAPTEKDTLFRDTQIRGMVHDPGAALYGGVAGHAGLFSTAHDLAKLMQMHLQGGHYGGLRYFNKGTVGKFTEQQYRSNRRGLGWDKPSGDTMGPTSYYASYDSFGHTGFTGTAAWADPEFNLIFIFLSNRIYPDADNAKLIKRNIRTRIQDLIYESIWSYEKSHKG